MASFSSLVLCLWVRPGAYPRVEHMKGASHWVGPANIILGWKGLPGTNTLAYYENPEFTVIKSFIGFAPAANRRISQNNNDILDLLIKFATKK
jgi:hypothetical protein